MMVNIKTINNNAMLGKLLQGRYQIIQVLSAGGFCQTYLAQDTSRPGNPTCVVKHLQPVNNRPDSLQILRQLFLREAQALKKLGNYDQVPQLLDHFEQNNEFYLVQEFIEGHPLSAELQPGQIWTESQVIELLQEVLGILEFVHSHGLIHRDIKPSNLIRRHQDRRLVLIDFGSVKQAWTQVVTELGQTSAKLAVGIPATMAIGTPGYMPTEQGRGRPRPNSDIYALGIVGIQALTGRAPTQLLEDSDTGEIIWQRHATVSALLASVLNKMVHYHFKDRYQSVTEALQALQPLVNRAGGLEKQGKKEDKEKPTSILPPSPCPPLPPYPQRGPRVPPSSSSPTSPKRPALLIGLCSGLAATLALIVGSYYFLQPPAPASKGQQYPVSIPLKNTDAGNITLANTLTGHSDSVWSVALSSNGQTLVSGSEDKTIKVWNLSTGQLLRTLSGHSDTVRSVALSPDGQTLASGSGDNTIKIWNVQTGKLLRTLSAHSGPVWSVAISRDGQTLVSGSEDKTIKIWNLQTGELRRILFGHSDQIFSVAISPDGQTVASGGIDKTINIWNLQTGKLLRTLEGHSDSVRSVAISPDGQKIASSSWDKTVKVWNLRTGKLLRTLEGHTARVVAIAFSEDGQTLASASIDNTIKIWYMQNGKLLANLTGHSDWVLSIATSTTGQTLISGSKDKMIKIWQ